MDCDTCKGMDTHPHTYTHTQENRDCVMDCDTYKGMDTHPHTHTHTRELGLCDGLLYVYWALRNCVKQTEDL